MKVQLFTLNEITDTLRRLSDEEDSIKALLARGDFRTRFEACVSESRTQRDASSISALPERLVPITQNGEQVYILDDIQGALSKQQFALFMKFIRTQPVTIDPDGTSYMPTSLVEQFIQSESANEADTLPNPTEDDNTFLKFA